MSNESATDTLRNWGTKSIGQGFLDVKKGKMKIEIGERGGRTFLAIMIQVKLLLPWFLVQGERRGGLV